MPLDVPALHDVARESAGLVDGVTISLTFQFAGTQITAVHISPGLLIKDDKTELWRSLDRLLGLNAK